MSSPSLFFIHNPVSGNSARSEPIQRIKASIQDRFTWRETNSPRDATRLAREAAKGGADIIVAVGGDGTVHEVVNGIMATKPGDRPALGIIPVGNGNDFAMAAGVPPRYSDALNSILQGNSHAVDIGSIENEEGVIAYWANSCGIGLNAKIAIRARRFKALNGELKYIAAAITSIWQDHNPIEMDIAADNHRFSERTTLLTLGNGPREGGGFLMAPGAAIDDGHFDLLFVGDISRFGLLRLLPSARKGNHIKSRAVFLRDFTKLRVKASEPLAIHLDGEIFAAPSDNVRHITARIHPEAIRVIR